MSVRAYVERLKSVGTALDAIYLYLAPAKAQQRLQRVPCVGLPYRSSETAPLRNPLIAYVPNTCLLLRELCIVATIYVEPYILLTPSIADFNACSVINDVCLARAASGWRKNRKRVLQARTKYVLAPCMRYLSVIRSM